MFEVIAAYFVEKKFQVPFLNLHILFIVLYWCFQRFYLPR